MSVEQNVRCQCLGLFSVCINVDLCVCVCVCCDKSAFGAQSCLDTRHLERVAVATKKKRLEAGTMGSRTPSTEIEAESKRKRQKKRRKEVMSRAERKDTKGGGVLR